MHRWQRGPMQWIANPQNRQFESDSVLQFFKNLMLGSSIGLGHRPFTAGRGVRFPYRVPVVCGISLMVKRNLAKV